MSKYAGYIFYALFIFSFILISPKLYPQENNTTKDQTGISKDEIPITTSSQEAREKYIQGLSFLENMQLEKARPLFEEAVKADPDFALGYIGLFQTGGGFARTKQNLDKAVSLKDKVSEGEKHLILLSKNQFEGNVSGAKDEIKQLLTMFPNDKRVHLYAGISEQFTNHDYNAAIEHYKKAISIDQNFAPAYNVMGYAYSSLNDFNKAEDSFKKYISLSPNTPNPYDSYAELLLKNGRYDASIEQYQKALEIDPAFYSSIEGIGNNYLFKGDFTKARESYQNLVDQAEVADWKLNGLYDLTVSFVREGDITNALNTLDKRISLADREGSVPGIVNSHILQGAILAENGKPEEAAKHFDMASEKVQNSSIPDQLKDNFNSQIKLNKLYSMVVANKLDQASSELQDRQDVIGSAANPQQEKSYEAILGMLALKQNKYDEALQHLSKADGENPLTWYYQSLAYQKKGDTQKANQLIDKIKQSNQNSLELAIANNHIKETVTQNK